MGTYYQEYVRSFITYRIVKFQGPIRQQRNGQRDLWLILEYFLVPHGSAHGHAASLLFSEDESVAVVEPI